MMVMILLGTLAGSALLASGNPKLTTTALGIVLTAYAAYTLVARPRSVPVGWHAWLSPTVGLMTGLVTGATGIFVVPAVPYLQSLELEPDELVQALGLSFTVSTVALAMGLLWHNATSSGNLLASMLVLIPAVLGLAAGQAIRGRISRTAFRRLFLSFLLLLGLEMALRPLL
jgi:uncharacterized membrane protein YfcA